MRFGLGMGLGAGGTTALQRALGTRPNAQVFSRFDSKYGAGGLYYSESALKTFTGVIATPPVGEPTSAGMGVFGAATPLIAYSKDFSEWGLHQDATLAFNTETGSDGLLSASRVGNSDGQNSASIFYDLVVTGRCQAVIRVKAGTASTLHFGLYVGGWVAQTAEIVSGPGAVSGSGIQSVTGLSGTEWTVIRVTLDASQTNPRLFIYPETSSTGSGKNIIFDYAQACADLDAVIVDPDLLTDGALTARAAAEPKLVQGAGPVPYPGYDEVEQTIGIVWNANGVTGDRVLCELRKDAGNRIPVHFVSGNLRLESFVGGTSEGFVAVPGVDDGGVHSAVLRINWVTGELSLDVDQQGLEGPELITNGGFGSAADWSLTGSAPEIEIADGVLKFNTSGANHQATQSVPIHDGVTYRARGDFVKVSGPHNLKVRLGGIDGEEVSGIATEAYDRIMVAGSSDEFRVRSNGDVVSTVDNASLVRCSTRTGVTLPTNLTEFHLGHSGGANQLNGYLLEHAAANGDQLSAWT